MQAPSSKGSGSTLRKLFIADLALEKLHSKALVFIRTASTQSSSGTNAGISCLELLPSMVDAFLGGLGGLLDSPSASTATTSPQQQRRSSSSSSPLLRHPDPQFLLDSGKENLVIAALTADSPAAVHLSGILEDWCSTVESVLCSNNNENIELQQVDQHSAGVGAGTVSTTNANVTKNYTLESEMERCRQRAVLLGQLINESQEAGAAAVCQVAAAFAPVLLKRWRRAETRLEQEVLHAEESVAVLTQLTPALKHLFVAVESETNSGEISVAAAISSSSTSLEEVQHALPRAFQKLRAAATASQVYSDLANLGHVLGVLGGGLAQRCKDSVTAGAVKLWDQPKPALINKLTGIVDLYTTFERHCRDLLTVLANNNNQKQQLQILQSALSNATSTFSFVAKRASRLRVLFTAVERFTLLSKQAAHIPGVPAIVASFFELSNGLRRGSASSADILDPSSSVASSTEVSKQPDVFERDMLDFQVHVNDLELALQDALRAAFENAVSTDHALGLLRQHATLLPSDVVDNEVDFMFSIAFQRFAADLEQVESHYEKFKTDPPLPRGTTPIAGSIQWSRSLLRRIEIPMRQFAVHEPLISAKESKKTIKLYNRLAQTFLEFEGLLHAAWVKSAESAVALLHVPVLIQHPSTLQLHVNLDAAVSRVLTEGAWVGRMGLPLPDKVKKAMLAAESLKTHHGALAAAVAALAGAQATLPAALKPLGQAMTRGVLCRAEPGMSTVFWTSATLNGFIHLLTQAVHRFCQVVQRIGDMHLHRVESAAHAAAKIQFMVLSSASGSSSCADFVKVQEEHLKKQSEVLLQKDAEVRAGCEEIIHLVVKELQQNGLHVDSKACEQYRSMCAQLIREAGKEAAEKSVLAFITRLTSEKEQRSSTATTTAAPLLSLELRVDVPAVAAHPSIEKVKDALTTCASNVLAVLEKLPAVDLEITTVEDKEAKKRESSKQPRRGSVTSARPRRPSGRKASTAKPSSTTTTTAAASLKSLSEAVDTMRGAVDTHIRAFQPFNFLWTSDKEQAYGTFMQGAPSLEESEGQLRNLVSLQTELEAVPPTLSIFSGSSAVVLTTDPLKHAVRAEIADWKAQFARRLQSRALSQLHDLQSRSRDLTMRLSRKIEDIQDVDAVVQALKEAREEEIDEERRSMALEEIYALLARYGVPVPKEETDALGDLSHSHKLVKQAAAEASKNLSASQASLVQSLRSLSTSLAQESARLRASWETSGPTIVGLIPTEAAARLFRFKAEFEGYKKKWERVVSGESLFGLPKTPLPGLEKTQEEIASLEQLYGWYTAVISAVQERGAMLWTATASNLEAISIQISEFSGAGKKMPKSLRDWPAYKDCRRFLDEFSGLLPLLEGLSHPAVRDRHWKELAVIAGASVSLPLPSEGLTLGDLLAAGLIAHREEVEDLCAAVVKEDALERKLKAVTEQWASELFTFAEHKQRGPVVLKVRQIGIFSSLNSLY
jgi:dynein heavy chain, axonemal